MASEKMPNAGLLIKFVENPHVINLPKKKKFEQKIPGRHKLGESFCCLAYLGICKCSVTWLMNFCVGRNYYIAVAWTCVHF